MDQTIATIALVALLVSGTLFLTMLTAERLWGFWRKGEPGDKNLSELKAYTHVNIHELRGHTNDLGLKLEVSRVELTKELSTAVISLREMITDNSERIAHLEAKADAQTESLASIVKLLEGMLRRKGEE